MKVKSESEVAQTCWSIGFSRQEYWRRVPLPTLPWWLSGKESAYNAGDAGDVWEMCRFDPWV